MNIETNFPLKMDKHEIFRILGKKFSRILKQGKNEAIYKKIMKLIPNLYKPSLIWTIYSVEKIDHSQFVLDNGLKIGGGPVVQVMEEAKEILLGVCTVGEIFDSKIEKLREEKDFLSAVILENFGSYLVESIREEFYFRIKGEMRKQGKFVSIPLCPGESEWSVFDQKLFFDLLHPEQIGIQLKESMLMVPMKSLSFMFGLSNIKFNRIFRNKCEFCLINQKCKYRNIIGKKSTENCPEYPTMSHLKGISE